MRALFFSDTHLLKGDETKLDLLEEFFRQVAQGADALFVLGDMFEFFCGFRHYTYPWYEPVIRTLTQLVRSETRVYYIEGNHEINLEKIQDATGISCAGPVSVDLDGRRTFISHGDEFTSPRLRRLIKSNFVRSTLDRCGPSFAWGAGMTVHHLLSRKRKGDDPRVKEIFRGYARGKFDEGYEAVVLGHSHIPDFVEETRGLKRCCYLNTGDFVESSSYGEYTSEAGFRLKTFRRNAR